jgi:elongation factor Ts
MAVTAAQVKELREQTGAGMMECKKALTETDGNLQEAVDLMRKKGQAKADKKASRTAAEGMVIVSMSDDAKQAVMVEVNCETDFVAREAQFIEFVQQVADLALAHKTGDVAALMAMPVKAGADKTVEERRKELVLKIGENLQVRRVVYKQGEGVMGAYIHGGRIGVLVDMSAGDADLARDIAMHIVASQPLVVRAEELADDVLAKEREIFTAQALESGKPAEIAEKMVVGRIKKFLAEVSLYGQPFVKDPSQTVEQRLKEANANVASFVRFAVGEGIEKEVSNFAEEVRAQVQGQ